MKVGDLVRYKKFPHEKLHNSGMSGLIISETYILDEPGWVDASPVVDIMWNMDRGLSYPSGTVSWDYVDELEVVQHYE
jgi:hypothetical protein